MASINITEEEALIIYMLVSEVQPEAATVLNKMYRKMNASLSNASYAGIRNKFGGKNLTWKDVDGPLNEKLYVQKQPTKKD